MLKLNLSMHKLFDENLGSVSNSEELAQLKEKFSYYDPSYVAISAMTTRSDFRDWLDSLWKQYKPYADSNFKMEFKKQFNQRSWELYLGSTLLSRGYTLGSHSNAGPDFKIPYENKNIWIEAIAVEKGDGQDKVPNIEYGKSMDVPEKEMILRLTAGLRKKHQVYLSYLKDKLVNQQDPFVIAINRSSLEHVDPQIPLILKCLFAIGHQVLFLNRETPQTKIKNAWSARNSINKINGSKIEMFMFGDSSFEYISAVIYCDQNILNSPKDKKQMGDNLVIVHNSFARNPLPHTFFTFGNTWTKEGSQVKNIKKNA